MRSIHGAEGAESAEAKCRGSLPGARPPPTPGGTRDLRRIYGMNEPRTELMGVIATLQHQQGSESESGRES